MKSWENCWINEKRKYEIEEKEGILTVLNKFVEFYSSILKNKPCIIIIQIKKDAIQLIIALFHINQTIWVKVEHWSNF